MLHKIFQIKRINGKIYSNSRKISCNKSVNFSPTPTPRSATATKDKSNVKHKFVPCCELLMTTIGRHLDPLQVCPDWRQPRVVIVGSGMAGLSAALALINGGITNLLILEAKSRPGGRIHSCRVGEVTVDFGADYIEGGSVANPVYNLACAGRIIFCDKPKANMSPPEQYLTIDGRTLMPNPIIADVLNSYLQEAASLFTSDKEGIQNINLNEFLNKKLSGAIKELPKGERDDFIMITNGLLNQVRARWGEDLSLMSLSQYGSNISIPGGPICVSGGTQTLIESLLANVPKNCVVYNKPVQCIRWGTSLLAEPRATVLCCDGTEIPADYVISTVSLGVIKEQGDTFFSPNLPEYKKTAAESLGFGYINKIFLEYRKPFWVKSNGTSFKIAWSTEQLKARDNWVKGISTIKEVSGRGNVLMCTVSGKEALWTEKLSDSLLAEELTLFLRQVTNDPSIPCPVSITRSKWGSDVHFCGARTFMKLGSMVKHSCDLALPLPGLDTVVPPILLFAGEATCPGHTSTMQGARFSGLREAYRIIELTKLFKGPPPLPNIPTYTIPPCDSPDAFYPKEQQST